MSLSLLLLLICLVHLPFSATQTAPVLEHPMLGPVYPVPNNDSLLNFTFLFPTNPLYPEIMANYTLYEFTDSTNRSIFLSFSSSAGNCSVNGTPSCLPSAVPVVAFGPGHYVIGCFHWILYSATGESMGTAKDCVLGRTTMNLNAMPNANLSVSTVSVTNDSITILAAYPAELPYDMVIVTSVLNDTINPTSTDTSSNATYAPITTFVFSNLTSNTNYHICMNVTSSHSAIPDSQEIAGVCQSIQTKETTNSGQGNGAGQGSGIGQGNGTGQGSGSGQGGGNHAPMINSLNCIGMTLLLIIAYFL